MGDHNPHGDGSSIEAAQAAGHDDHDDHGGGHGHGDDPNAGVVRATPPTPAWVLTAALIGLVTVIATVILGFAINDAIPSDAPADHIETEQTDGEHAEGEEAPAEAEH
ncbi:MAG TPA: hypothetical protein VNA12_07785 [Mycobacteriales bacterium]|nr:hypothetical protein [Mycobacteriales bacterium]